MANINIKEKDKTSLNYDIKHFLDTDSNQVRGALQTADYDINTGDIVSTGLTVDTDTLVVDKTNNRVGIGTDSPSELLDIHGNFAMYGKTEGLTIKKSSAESGAGDDYKITNEQGNTNQRISILDGSATGPGESSIAFDFSTDGFSTIQRNFVVQHNGNVGIGETSPENPLHIYRNTSLDDKAMLQLEEDGSGDAYIRYRLTGSTSWSTGVDNSDSDKFKISSTTSLNSNVKLTLDKDGNVGIGTTGPDSKLHVAQDWTGASFGDVSFRITGSSDENKFLALGYDTTNNVGIIQSLRDGVGYTDLYLNPQGGNVSIGNPNTKDYTLNVNSDTDGRAINIEENGSAETWQIGVDSGGNLNFYNSGSTQKTISFSDTDDGTINMFTSTGSNNLRLFSDGDSFFNGGNVGIGLINPSGKLHVYRNTSDATIPVAFFEQDDPTNNQRTVAIQNDGTGPCAGFIQNQDVAVLDFDFCNDGGTSHTTIAGSLKVKMPNGSIGYINFYT